MSQQVVEQPAQQPQEKPEQKVPTTLLSSVSTFEMVMSEVGKFIAHPFVLIVGLITTIFLITREKNPKSDPSAENTELKEQIKILKSELAEMKLKFKKLKSRQGESESQVSGSQDDSQEYSIEYKASRKLPVSKYTRRTLFLD